MVFSSLKFLKKKWNENQISKIAMKVVLPFMHIECQKKTSLDPPKQMKAAATSVRQFDFEYLLYKFVI